MGHLSAAARRRGSGVLEFTLVGIPLVFVLLSTVEMARGMWLYHTVAYAVKEGTRFAIVHGSGCEAAPNSCSVTVGDVASHIAAAGIGLDAGELQVDLVSNQGTTSCAPLSGCFGNTAVWPPDGGNTVGMDITIRGWYPFRSAIAMFWPGAGRGMVFPAVTLPASSTEAIQF